MNNLPYLSPVKRLSVQLSSEDIQLKEELKQILLSVQQEKKAIEEEFRSMNDRIERYEKLQEKVEKEAAQTKSERSKQEQFIYSQLKATLSEMNINGDEILELGQPAEAPGGNWRKLDQQQIIRVQKILIERLLTKLRQQSQLLHS